ncbi:MAG: EAL domain-containing protein [Dokdonella sp.]
MARNFGLAVVAEGVETQAQLRFLQELGCDSAQGFLWREPMTADAFCQFVRTQSG